MALNLSSEDRRILGAMLAWLEPHGGPVTSDGGAIYAPDAPADWTTGTPVMVDGEPFTVIGHNDCGPVLYGPTPPAEEA